VLVSVLQKPILDGLEMVYVMMVVGVYTSTVMSGIGMRVIVLSTRIMMIII
jgi:hypothetical protein